MKKDSRSERKRQLEQHVVEWMLRLYCKKKHGLPEKQLCSACQELWDYARERTRRCPFMESKTFCSSCKVHCYRSDMRARIREIMRFSGPRMLYHHPLMAVHHMWCTVQARRIKEKKKHD